MSDAYPPDPTPWKPSKRRAGFALRVLLDSYNAMLGWSQADLARAMGRDTSWLSKIFTGASRPFDSTLIEIADVYHRAGLEEVHPQLLMEARDRVDDPYRDSLGIPDQWKRLIMTVLALPPEIQDALFMQISQMLTLVTKALSHKRGAQTSTLPQDAPDDETLSDTP